MSTNYKVSSDVDTMLRSANNASILSNIGAVSTSDLANKANIANPRFTGNVGIETSNPSEALEVTGNIKASGDIQSQTVTVSGNCNADGLGGTISTSSQPNITSVGTLTSLSVNGKIESLTSTIEASGCNFNSGTIGQVEFGSTTEVDFDLKAPNLVANNIKCIGETTATAQPLKFYSNDHRFGDYDQAPDDLLVIKKIDGYTGARVGINKDPSSGNAVALHVVAGKNASTDAEDLGLKVVGGSFFEDYIRVGHYTDETRDDINNPTNGTIIYNNQRHEFQGYVGGGTGWQKFNMGEVTTG